MEASWFNLSYQAIDIVESQEKMALMEATTFPHLESKDKQKLHREITKRGWPNSFQERNVVTLDQVAKIIGKAKHG